MNKINTTDIKNAIIPITLEPIGILHTPFKTKEGMPIQSIGAKGKKVKFN